MNEIEKVCYTVNQECIKLQGTEKEVVDELDAFAAYAYVKNMYLGGAGDVLLFCSALNLLNTYVKQKNSKVTYKFKNELGYLIGIAVNTTCEGVSFDLQKDGNNPLLVIQIYCIQFSFHNIPITKELTALRQKHLTTSLEWDGVRKQNCAVTLFKLAVNNMICRSNETFRGKDLEKKVQKLIENYSLGKMGFSDI